jgi:DNA-binding NtrC family response regulator
MHGRGAAPARPERLHALGGTPTPPEPHNSSPVLRRKYVPVRRRVLLVDDETSIHDALRPLLEIEGLDVVASRTLEGAMEALNDESFDVVLADLSLSGTGGREGLALAEWIRKERPALDVVLLTAYGGRDLEEEARRRGGIEVWNKGGDVVRLVQRIAHGSGS